MHGQKTRLNSTAYSSIADWFALNSNDLTWIALVTVGVIAVGMLMRAHGLTTFAVRLAALCAVQHSAWELRERTQLESLQAAIER